MVIKMDNLIEKIKAYPKVWDLLASCPLSILSKISYQHHKAKQFNLYQGGVYEEVFIILVGEIRVYIMDQQGKRVTLAIYGEGNLIGEHEALDKRPFSASLEGITDVELLRIKAEDYAQWLKGDIIFANKVIGSLCNQLYELTNKTAKYSLANARQQVILTLCSEYKKKGELLSKRVLFDSVSASNRSIYRILASLEQEGLIAVQENTVKILAWDNIMNLCKGD